MCTIASVYINHAVQLQLRREVVAKTKWLSHSMYYISHTCLCVNIHFNLYQRLTYDFQASAKVHVVEPLVYVKDAAKVRNQQVEISPVFLLLLIVILVVKALLCNKSILIANTLYHYISNMNRMYLPADNVWSTEINRTQNFDRKLFLNITASLSSNIVITCSRMYIP